MREAYYLLCSEISQRWQSGSYYSHSKVINPQLPASFTLYSRWRRLCFPERVKPMVEDGSLWEKMRRYVAPDHVVACVQVSRPLKPYRMTPPQKLTCCLEQCKPCNSTLYGQPIIYEAFCFALAHCLRLRCRWIQTGGLAWTAKRAFL